jgi:hypothetical protein
MVEAGRLDEGIAQLERDLGATRGWRRTLALCFLAEAFHRQREPERGLSCVAEALTMAERDLVGFHEPELYRLQGELVLQHTNGDAAQDVEASFRRAIEIARARQQKSLELRAATSLSRLLADRGNRAEARRVLGETYGWFSEGFEIRDVREAKRRLDQL